jgi:hypothetical protein
MHACLAKAKCSFAHSLAILGLGLQKRGIIGVDSLLSSPLKDTTKEDDGAAQALGKREQLSAEQHRSSAQPVQLQLAAADSCCTLYLYSLAEFKFLLVLVYLGAAARSAQRRTACTACIMHHGYHGSCITCASCMPLSGAQPRRVLSASSALLQQQTETCYMLRCAAC